MKRERARNWHDDDVFARINWRVYTHTELWDMIQQAAPGQLGAVAHNWGLVAQGVDATTAKVHEVVQRLMFSWRGPSAQQAAASVSALTRWAADASETAHTVGKGLDSYTSAVERAQQHMPEPVHYWAERSYKAGYDVKTLDGPNGLYMADQLMDDVMPSKKQADEAKERAIDVMRTYEASSRDVHNDLPQPFQAPPSTTDLSAADNPAPVRPDPRPDPVIGTPDTKPLRPIPDPSHPGAVFVGVPGTDAQSAGVDPVAPGYGSASGLGYGPGADSSSGRGAGFAGAAGPGSGVGVVGPEGAAGYRAVAGTRSGAQSSACYPPGAAGANREEDLEHKSKWGAGIDLLDDLPPAFPSVLGE
ncbi:PPE domain-containing protein [Actinocrispum wychmicini]|uniref:PPE domain-containing protein n=1 Tax=Actinocrispum wychmicini TaxID=1213861 RepID=UPI0010523714|nr:PPE domain-containing protein [Actinocrispum wychmicini]